MACGTRLHNTFPCLRRSISLAGVPFRISCSPFHLPTMVRNIHDISHYLTITLFFFFHLVAVASMGIASLVTESHIRP